ncbi:hypothetical protein ACQ4LE_000161, partial [Meloidogyne hapla]
MPIEVEKKHIGYYEHLPLITTEYPKSETSFVGHVPESKLLREIDSVPLEIERKHVGYYEQLPPTATEQSEKKLGTLEKLTQFLKGSKTEEFPVDSEPYIGPLEMIEVTTEAPVEPIHSFVSVYSSGRSDELPPSKMKEYPIIGPPFVGHIHETKLRSAWDLSPLEVEKKHVGYYEYLPATSSKTSEFPNIEPPYTGHVHGKNSQPELDSLPLDVEKKYLGYYEQSSPTSTKTSEYPKTEEPFIGHIHSLQLNEVESMPIELERKHIGFYEHLPPSKIEEKKPGAFEKLTKLFKGSETVGGYPYDSDPYNGQISKTDMIPEVTVQPIHSFVSTYSSGRSDEITSKHLPEHPRFEEIFIGNVFETKRPSELQEVPLDIENKHIGHYEHSPIPSIVEEKKPGALEKLTKLFKGSKQDEDFPSDSTPYTGLIAKTFITSESTTEPIHSMVSVYSSGRSDEIPTTKVKEFPINEAPFVGYVPESSLQSGIEHIPLDVEKKSIGYYEQLPSTSIKTSEFPKIEAPFVGHIPETKNHDIHPVPFEVENNYIGYYEHLPPTNQEEKPGALEKITNFFKGSKTEGGFPVDSEPYFGSLAKIEVVPEAAIEPLHSMVSVYSSGRSDEIKTTKITEFPINEAPFVDYVPDSIPQAEMFSMPLQVERSYVGHYEHLPTKSVKEPSVAEHLFKTERHSELAGYQLNNLVNVYSSGHSDEFKITKKAEFPSNEEPYYGIITEAKRQHEVDNMPLELETKHVGYYEHLPSKTTDEEEKKPGALEKLTHFFKGSKHIEGYPLDSELYTGPLSIINPLPETPKEPINSFVTVYSSGRSDEIPLTTTD